MAAELHSSSSSMEVPASSCWCPESPQELRGTCRGSLVSRQGSPPWLSCMLLSPGSWRLMHGGKTTPHIVWYLQDLSL